MSDFKVLILDWYRQNKRNLPWREDRNPYKIWLSEIILQQTRVEQGRSYYLKFIEHYPSVDDLHAASEEEVLHLWQGLGYYSRARNLKFAASQLVQDYNSKFPSTRKELLQLKGVGQYTAAAIASIAFDAPHAVVDGNVYRVLSRLFEDSTPIDTPSGQKHFQEIANELLDRDNPGDYNQAIMELGALVCSPKSPKCDQCPVLELCGAGRKQTWDKFPVKSKKIKVKKRNLHFLIAIDKDNILIQKRTHQDIWKNLYQFPLAEVSTSKEAKHYFKKQFSLTRVPQKIYDTQHKLTHQHLNIRFYLTDEVDMQNPPNQELKMIPIDTIENYPFPIVIKNFINSSELFLHS